MADDGDDLNATYSINHPGTKTWQALTCLFHVLLSWHSQSKSCACIFSPGLIHSEDKNGTLNYTITSKVWKLLAGTTCFLYYQKKYLTPLLKVLFTESSCFASQHFFIQNRLKAVTHSVLKRTWRGRQTRVRHCPILLYLMRLTVWFTFEWIGIKASSILSAVVRSGFSIFSKPCSDLQKKNVLLSSETLPLTLIFYCSYHTLQVGRHTCQGTVLWAIKYEYLAINAGCFLSPVE